MWAKARGRHRYQADKTCRFSRVIVLQDRKLAAQGFSPVTYSLSANACAYNSPELSHRSNNDTIYLSSPDMQNAHYLTLPQLATTLPHGFQVPHSDGEPGAVILLQFPACRLAK